MDDLALLHEIMVLMQGRWPPPGLHIDFGKISFDVAFVFGRAAGDWESEGSGTSPLFDVAGDLWKGSFVRRIALPGYDATRDAAGHIVTTGYPGFRTWCDLLEADGVPPGNVYPTAGHGTNTKTEGDDFIALAQQQSWHNAIVTMHPHQVLRAMLGLVRSLQLASYEMNIVPLTPLCVNWQKPVFGSQGQGGMPRSQHIAWEWERIVRYQAKGDVASFGELKQYLLKHL